MLFIHLVPGNVLKRNFVSFLLAHRFDRVYIPIIVILRVVSSLSIAMCVRCASLFLCNKLNPALRTTTNNAKKKDG